MWVLLERERGYSKEGTFVSLCVYKYIEKRGSKSNKYLLSLDTDTP